MTSLFLVLLSAAIHVPVHLAWQATGPPACTGVIRAEAQPGPAASSTASIDNAGTAALVVPRPGAWQVSLASENCWAASTLIDVHPAGRDVELRTWPKGVMSGSLRTTSRVDSRLPETVEVQVRPSPERGRPADNAALAAMRCPVVDGTWRCDGPVTALDLRVAADGFAPLYFWNVESANGHAQVPATVLQPGASLSGWVENAKGHPAAGATVELAPVRVSPEAARVSGLSTQTATVLSTERGFFQFHSLNGGDYTIAARTDAHDAAKPQEISIHPPEEHALPRVLVLEPPTSVQVQIEPPLSPDRRPWNVQLSRAHVADGLLQKVASGQADELGLWRTAGIAPGSYEIAVRDPAGAIVARLHSEIDGDGAVLDIRVGTVPVSGRVRVGTQPIAAEFKFFSEAGSVRFLSRTDGVFEGSLPAEGAWNVQITPEEALQRVRTRVDVQVPPDDSTATVDIDLPAGQIEGTVVDEDGKPLPGVEVLVLRGNDVAANAGSDREGRFQVMGLEPGPFVLYAKTRDLFSDHQPCTVSAVSATRQTLVLRAPAELAGRMLRASGAPLVGALIRYFRGDEMLTTVSGPTGRFALDLSPGTQSADIVVVAPQQPVLFEHVVFAGQETTVTVPDVAAVLRIVPRYGSGLPTIARPGTRRLSVSTLFAPRADFGPPRESTDRAIELHVAPGAYNICHSRSADCVEVTARAGVVSNVNPPSTGGSR